MPNSSAHPDAPLLSPSLAGAFLGCAASAAWTLETRRNLRPEPVELDDPHAALVIAKGHEHEAVCLAARSAEHGEAVVIPGCDIATRAALTAAAMRSPTESCKSRSTATYSPRSRAARPSAAP